MDLIRTLLQRLTDMKIQAGGAYVLGPNDEEMQVEGYIWDEVHYNFQLMLDHGLIDAPFIQGGDHFLIRGLTWEGHEFYETIKNPEVWTRTQAGLKKVGGMGVDLALALAKAEGKRFLQEKLGIQL